MNREEVELFKGMRFLLGYHTLCHHARIVQQRLVVSGWEIRFTIFPLANFSLEVTADSANHPQLFLAESSLRPATSVPHFQADGRIGGRCIRLTSVGFVRDVELTIRNASASIRKNKQIAYQAALSDGCNALKVFSVWFLALNITAFRLEAGPHALLNVKCFDEDASHDFECVVFGTSLLSYVEINAMKSLERSI